MCVSVINLVKSTRIESKRTIIFPSPHSDPIVAMERQCQPEKGVTPGWCKVCSRCSSELANCDHVTASARFASVCASHFHHLPLSLLLKTSCRRCSPSVCATSVHASIPITPCHACCVAPCSGPCIAKLSLAEYSIIIFVCMSLVTIPV